MDLYYELIGRGEPLVLIAGYTCEYTFWEPIIPHLKDTYEMLIFDNRGVGMSPVPDEPYTTQDMAKDVASLIKGVGFDTPHVLGSSMGGAIAQELTQITPMKSLTLSVTFPKLNKRAQMALEANLSRFEKGEPLEVIAASTIPWIFSSHFLEQHTLDELIQPKHQTPAGIRGQFGALRTFDSRKYLSKIDLPTLIIAGGQDILCPLDDSRYLAEHIKGSHLEVMHNVGHGAHAEEPENYTTLIKNFHASLD